VNLLYITAWDAAGQQFNGYHLHKALRATGHDSHMAVVRSSLKEPEIHELDVGRLGRLNERLARLERAASLYGILPVSAVRLYGERYYQAADIVHLQLPHALPFFSLLNVPLMSRQHRVVWSMHDPWLTSGHCIYSLTCERWQTGCGQCPDLNLPMAIYRDTTAAMWRYKHWVMHHSKLTLVVASEWMRERVRRSPILGHLPVHLIPYGLDRGMFHPRGRAECRAQLNVPQDAIVLAFRASAYAKNYKGADYIEQALASLEFDRPVYLLIFEGVCHSEALKQRFHVVELGWVADPQQTADVLRAADIFLMPSTAEAFGMMAVEAMACGTPVIVFEGTALPAVVKAPHAGIAVPYGDAQALAQAIRTVLDDQGLHQSLVENGLNLVAQEYTVELYVQRHLDLYHELLAEPVATPKPSPSLPE
jgi:glycosyltransferase involved in cell wall biosynthesis